MKNKIKGEYNFKKDLSKGKAGEDEVINYMKKLGFCFVNRCNDNRYDIIMNYKNKIYTYEIKTDIYPKDTGNIAIEIESRGKPSGISVTKADYFVTFFKHKKEIWNIKTDELKDLILKNNLKLIENAGDTNSNTKLYLINKSKFKKHFRVHKIL